MNNEKPETSKSSTLKEVFENAEAIIFDFDGTLVDSLWVWEKVDRNFFEKHNLEMTPDYLKTIEGMSFRDCAKYVIEKFGLKSTVEEIMEGFIKDAEYEYANDVKFKEGAIELLKWLDKKGIKYGIATSGNIKLVNSCLEANKMQDVFKIISTTGTEHRSKPFPDVYQSVADKLGVNRNKCVVIEDTCTGLEGAKNAHMTSVHIKDTHNKKDWERASKLADYCIDDFVSLNKLLEQE